MCASRTGSTIRPSACAVTHRRRGCSARRSCESHIGTVGDSVGCRRHPRRFCRDLVSGAAYRCSDRHARSTTTGNAHQAGLPVDLDFAPGGNRRDRICYRYFTVVAGHAAHPQRNHGVREPRSTGLAWWWRRCSAPNRVACSRWCRHRPGKGGAQRVHQRSKHQRGHYNRGHVHRRADVHRNTAKSGLRIP